MVLNDIKNMCQISSAMERIKISVNRHNLMNTSYKLHIFAYYTFVKNWNRCKLSLSSLYNRHIIDRHIFLGNALINKIYRLITLYIYNSSPNFKFLLWNKERKKDKGVCMSIHISLKILNCSQLENIRDVPLDVSYSQRDSFVHITHVSNDRNVTSWEARALLVERLVHK